MSSCVSRWAIVRLGGRPAKDPTASLLFHSCNTLPSPIRLPEMPKCVVSFVDIEGIRHSVEIEDADGVFEATTKALRVFRDHDCMPGTSSKIEVEIFTSVVHTVDMKRLRDWAWGVVKGPKYKIIKDQAKELLGEKSRQ